MALLDVSLVVVAGGGGGAERPFGSRFLASSMALYDEQNNRFGLNVDPILLLLPKLVLSVSVAVSNVNDGLRSGRGISVGESSEVGSTSEWNDVGREASLGLHCPSSKDSFLKDPTPNRVGTWFRDGCDRLSTWNDG